MTNYQRVLDAELAKLTAAKVRPRLLLHACCAPCSSYTLEYLAAHFDITVLFYNPNIAPAAEYDFRAAELARYIADAPCGAGVKLRDAPNATEPHKDAGALNAIGGELATACGVPYLFSDFKKKGGYARSIVLSHEYGLYRQNYCGCVYSKRAAENREAEHEQHSGLS